MINQNKKYVSDAYNGTIVELSFENRDLANEGHYALPTAVNGIPGAVKPDNQTLVVDADGTLSVNTDRIPLLSEGILPSSVVPAVAISSVHVVDSEEAMLALAGAEEGDVAIRSDLNKTFILSVSDPGSYADLANWKEILTSSNTILSVNGQTGAVALDAEDVGAAPAVHTHSSLTDGTNTLSIPAKSGTIATTDDIPVVPPAPAIPTIAAGSNGNFAALDGSGNIIDSEYVSGDFETAGSITLHDGLNTAHSALFAAKADTVHAHSSLTDGTNTLSIPAKSGTIATTDDIPVVPPAPAIPTIAAGSNGNFAALDGSGNIIDSEYVSSDFEAAGSITLHNGSNTAHSDLFAAKADTVHAHSSLTDGTNTLSIPAKSGVIATTEDIPWINQKANDRQIVMYSGETTYGQKSLGSSGIDATELQSAMLTIRNGIVTPISLQTSLMNKSDTSHTHSSLVNNGYTLTAPVKSGTIATTADIIRPIVLLSVPTGTALCCTPGTEPVMYTGDRTLTGVSTNNICRFNLKELGDHTFFIRGGKYKTFNIDCVKLYRFSFADVYGAMIDDTQSDPSLTRLEDAVGKTFTPQIGAAQEGASDFDALEIYKDIKLCNLVDGEVAYYEGDAGFSRTPASGDVMVEIPKFYYKIDKTETDKTKILISAMQQEGYSISPAHCDRGDGIGERDRIYVGAYHSDVNFRSISGSVPKDGITRSAFRTGHTARGAGYYTMDFASYWTIALLFLVEAGTRDSQSAVAPGYNNYPEICANGTCDNIGYHSGRGAASETAYHNGMVYRNIENLWGNCWTFLDGINLNRPTVYIALNPLHFADNTSENYIALSQNMTTTDGQVKIMSSDAAYPWAFIPAETGDSNQTSLYWCDHIWGDQNAVPSGNWASYIYGGYSDSTHLDYPGLFYYAPDNNSSYTSPAVSGRLMFLPQ